MNCELQNRGAVLLVEDNNELNIANSRALRLRGYAVETALTLAEARQWLSRIQPDIILLDIMLPDGDGMDFCREIRESTTAHILFLTGKTEHEDMVRGLTGGGDDYIVKPFHPEGLLARIDAVMRRRNMEKTPAQILSKGSLTLDIIASQAFMAGKDLQLSQKEFAILLLLIQNEGKTLSAETVYENVWGQPMGSDKNALQTAVYRLRKKIEHTGYDIMTERLKGYSFEKA